MLRQALPLLAASLADDRLREMRRQPLETLQEDEEEQEMGAKFRHEMRTRDMRPLLLLHTVRLAKAADVERCEQLLPLCASLKAELGAHPEFAAGLVSVLLAEPARLIREAPRLAACAVMGCLLPLALVLPHAHAQLRRLFLAQPAALHAIASPLDAAQSQSAAGLSSEQGPSVLQVAAREARQSGAIAEGEKRAVEEEYGKLAKRVPGVFGS